jgi:hypothetical protein
MRHRKSKHVCRICGFDSHRGAIKPANICAPCYARLKRREKREAIERAANDSNRSLFETKETA